MNPRPIPMALAAALLLSACADATRREEARQLAWTGPGAGPCAFGGATPRAADHCALVTSGVEGMLYAVNEQVRERFGAEAPCTEHVEAVRAQLARHPALKTERIYSCPLQTRALRECHVSLLVTTRSGRRYVVDNGAVVSDTVGAGGVARFADYRSAVENAYWIGFPPSAAEFAQLEAGRKPKRGSAAKIASRKRDR